MKRRHDLAKLYLVGFLLIHVLMGYAVPIRGMETPSDPALESYVQDQNWSAAEAYLLNQLWQCRSGNRAVEAAERLARICVFVHKGPMAMEWLEFAAAGTEISPAEKSRIHNNLEILHKIYLPSEYYSRDPRFRITSIDLESPKDIEMTDDDHLIIMDRYRIINTAETDTDVFQPIHPTSTLPDDAQTLKLVENDPVIITSYGYWKNLRINGFLGRGELNRIIDAVFTVDDTWLVLDRRHADMLRFDADGNFEDALPIAPVHGDEKLVQHVFGGCWMIHFADRHIVSVGSGITTRIPFKGPGYRLVDPVDMATDWFGHLYVLCEDGSVTIFSPSGVRLRNVTLDSDSHHLRAPCAIAVGLTGSLYIADRKNHAIYRYQ